MALGSVPQGGCRNFGSHSPLLIDHEADAKTPHVCTKGENSQAVSRQGNHNYTWNNKWSEFRQVNLPLHPLKLLMVSWGPQFAVNWCKSEARLELMEIRCARSEG